MEIEIEVIEKEKLTNKHRMLFAEMLEKQGKVRGNLCLKADRCKFVCIASVDNKVAAIGAIKEKSASSFSANKAEIPELCKEFEWEIGYLFTSSDYRGLGLATDVTKTLIQYFGNDNLMASTETSANPGMVKILERNGFKLFGNPWKSSIHDNYLGLFLKFK